MPSKPTTFASVAQDLIKDAESRVALGQNAPTLVRDYKHRLRAYCVPFFGKASVTTIDTRRLREFRDWLAKKEIKQSTILTIMAFVSKTLKMAHEDGLIRQMPSIPTKGQKPSPRPAFTREQYRKLLSLLRELESGKLTLSFKGNVVDWELRALVTFAVNSFLRPGDLFDLKNKHVTVVPADQDGPSYLRLDAPSSKGHDAPVITMPVAVDIYERVLERHRKAGHGQPDDYVFMPSKLNRDYAHEVARRLFRAVLKHADLLVDAKGNERTLYSLRHTAIVFRLLQADDLDLLTLARTCRTSVEMIDRYYAQSLTAEMNRDKLHSFRRPTRYQGTAA